MDMFTFHKLKTMCGWESMPQCPFILLIYFLFLSICSLRFYGHEGIQLFRVPFSPRDVHNEWGLGRDNLVTLIATDRETRQMIKHQLTSGYCFRVLHSLRAIAIYFNLILPLSSLTTTREVRN